MFRNLPSVRSFCAALALVVLASTPGFAQPAPAAPLAFSQPLTVKWRYTSDQATNFTPATDGKSLYVPLSGGAMIALNATDGRLLWRAEAGGEFSATPCADEQVVYVATQYPAADTNITRGALRAVSKETGITLWMRTLQAPVLGVLVAGQGALFAGSANGNVYAFDKRTGRTIWVNQYGDGFESHPALAGNRLYIGSNAGWLLALSQSTGELIWSFRARGSIQGAIAITNGMVFFGSGDGYVYAVSEAGAKLRWKRRTGAAVQAVVSSEDGVIASSFDNFAYLLSLKKGDLVWRQLLPGRVAARPLTAPDGALFTPLSTDNAIVLSLKNGKPVNTMSIGEENSSSAAPIAASDVIILTTPHGLLAFSNAEQRPVAH